jgi:hypothetical protein
VSNRLDEAALGYRLWVAKDGRLCALDGHPWPSGDVAARCRQHADHAAPVPECGCGLYLLHRRPTRIPRGCVLGVAVAWGVLEVHLDGLRAQHARPVALAQTPSIDSNALATLSERYGVPVVEDDLLEVVAQEFGAFVPAQHHPADCRALLGRLERALTQRERCVSSWDLALTDGNEGFLLQTLALLEYNDQPDLGALLEAAWHGPRIDRPRSIAAAMASLRRGLEEMLRTRSLDHDDIEPALRALHAAHGSVRTAIEELVARRGADCVPDGCLLHPSVAPAITEVARGRAQKLVAGSSGSPSPVVDQALLVLEPTLDDGELARHAGHMCSSRNLQRLLAQAGPRGSRLARAVLAGSTGIGTLTAARHLAPSGRALLLRHLRRGSWTFEHRDPIIDDLIGAQALRLASERAMRCASDAVNVASALALLPGDEAREPLRRLVVQVNGLSPSAGGRLRERAWNCICSRPHLARQLDRDTVRAAVRDPTLHPTNRFLLLRAHPDADHATALSMWKDADLAPPHALDVLRATGPEQQRLVDDALQHTYRARHDNARAARLCAAIVIAAEASDADPARIASIVGDVEMPASVRAVAAYVATQSPLPTDPAMRPYEHWRNSKREERGLTELLSGTWLQDTVM